VVIGGRTILNARLLCVALVASVALAAGPAAANASIPSYQVRLDAKRFARDWWASRNWRYGDGTPNCSGVRLLWVNRRQIPRIRGVLGAAVGCNIVLNKRVKWAIVPERGGSQTTNLGSQWWRFCAVVIHEYGHLPGMPYNYRNPPTHSRSPNNVMASTEFLNTYAWWWPYFPGCRYENDGVEWE
jgi:hypothetical protein